VIAFLGLVALSGFLVLVCVELAKELGRGGQDD
jgi:hypothetical protein